MMKKFFGFLCTLLFSLGAWADLYDVKGLPISAETNSAQEARTMAILNGQADAFGLLIKRMVLPEDVSRVPMLSEEQITNLVQTVSLSNEKNTSTRYMANLNVRFNPDKIQALLRDQQIPFLSNSLPSTVIIPILKTREGTRILEENNPVYIYLKDRDISNPLWDVVVPVGDLEEVDLAQRLLQTDQLTDWMTFAEKYGVKRVLLLTVLQQGAYLSVQADSIPILAEIPDTLTFDVLAQTGNITKAMPTLWKRLTDLQEKAWREAKTNDLTEPLTLWLRVSIRHLSEWPKKQEQLDKASFLQGYAVRAFRPNEVLVQLTYKGQEETLVTQLKRLGFTLERTNIDGLWEAKTPTLTGEWN